MPSNNEISFDLCLVFCYQQSNNAVTSGNGVDQEVASHDDQDLTVDMGTNSDSTPFLGFDVIFQAKPLRVLSLFDGVFSGNVSLKKYVLE